MTILTTLLALFMAALLEAGGDALVRKGLHSPAVVRIGLLLAGAAMLFAYGYTVNAPSWNFGRIIGVYMVFFFVVAQVIGWLVFGQIPGTRILLGGACIIAGGIIISAG
jgi:small multidrug resistance family-3 protein